MTVTLLNIFIDNNEYSSFLAFLVELFINRDVASILHKPSILETNQGTLFKFDIKSDRSLPQMDVEFSK